MNNKRQKSEKLREKMRLTPAYCLQQNQPAFTSVVNRIV